MQTEMDKLVTVQMNGVFLRKPIALIKLGVSSGLGNLLHKASQVSVPVFPSKNENRVKDF